MLKYLNKEQYLNSEYKDLFRRKSEKKRIQNLINSDNKLLAVIMLDDNNLSIQGIAIISLIGNDNDYWSLVAIRKTKEYKDSFIRIVEENITDYLNNNQIGG